MSVNKKPDNNTDNKKIGLLYDDDALMPDYTKSWEDNQKILKEKQLEILKQFEESE
jgi:hypothetical protein